jgi:hypothetical protein
MEREPEGEVFLGINKVDSEIINYYENHGRARKNNIET